MSDQPTVHLHRCNGSQAGTGAWLGLSGKIVVITKWLYETGTLDIALHQTLCYIIHLDSCPVEKVLFSLSYGFSERIPEVSKICSLQPNSLIGHHQSMWGSVWL